MCMHAIKCWTLCSADKLHACLGWQLVQDQGRYAALKGPQSSPFVEHTQDVGCLALHSLTLLCESMGLPLQLGTQALV